MVLTTVTAMRIASAHAETPAAMCERVGTDDRLRQIPETLVPAANTAFGTSMPVGVAIATTVFRCFEGRVLACMSGANLPCGPANTSTKPASGVTKWCRDNRDTAFIPATVVGHDTIYDWRCQGGVPQIVHRMHEVDPRGFIAQYWKVLP